MHQRRLVFTDVALSLAQIRPAFPLEVADLELLLSDPDPWDVNPRQQWLPLPGSVAEPVPCRMLRDHDTFPQPDIFRVMNVNLLGTDQQMGWVRARWEDCRSALVQLYAERPSSQELREHYVADPRVLAFDG